MNLRTLVSQNKKRYQMHSFDLDLTYITDQVVAMGFPSESIESVYRNPMSEVQRFFETFHSNHYTVYNLCSERDYKDEKFCGRVERYPFDDHNCPTIELIEAFCDSVETWLHAHRSNVVAVHCKAGKGRTGLMITCWILYSGLCDTAQEALEYYAFVRCVDQKGVTIPSQIRFVEYFERLKTYGPVPHVTLALRSLIVHTVPKALLSKIRHYNLGVRVLLLIYGEKEMREVFVADALQKTVVEVKGETREAFILQFPQNLFITGSTKMEFFYRDLLGRPTTIFRFWFHCSFIGSSNQLLLTKNQIDGAHKDHKHRLFEPSFRVLVEFGDVPPGVVMERLPPGHNDTPLGHLVHHYNREGMRARRGTVARMTGSQRLFVYKLRLLRHKTLYSIGELESILEKDLRSLAEATDTEIATNEKRMQQVRVMGQLLTSIREYMRDMPICKAYFSPFPPASHLDHSARSSVRPLIKDGEEILSKLLKLKIVTQAASDMQHVALFLRYINGLSKWYDMGTEELHGKRRREDLERDIDELLLSTKLASSSSFIAGFPSGALTSPVDSPPISPRGNQPTVLPTSSQSAQLSPPTVRAASPTPLPMQADAASFKPPKRSWLPADACEGKDLERVRAAVANIRDATRAASLSPDARRARALRASRSEKQNGVKSKSSPSVWTISSGGTRIGASKESGISRGIAMGRKMPEKPLPETSEAAPHSASAPSLIQETPIILVSNPPTAASALDDNMSARGENKSQGPPENAQPDGCGKKALEVEKVYPTDAHLQRRGMHLARNSHRTGTMGDGAVSLDRAMKRMNVRDLEVRSTAEGDVKNASLAAFLVRSPPSARLSSLQLGSNRSARDIRGRFRDAESAPTSPSTSSDGSTLGSSLGKAPSQALWNRRRSVTIDHPPSGEENGIDEENDHVSTSSTTTSDACGRDGNERKKEVAKKQSVPQGDGDQTQAEEKRNSVWERFTLIANTIERVVHLLAALQIQLDHYESLLLSILPASELGLHDSSPSTAPPSCSPTTSPASLSPVTVGRSGTRVHSIHHQHKVAVLQRIRSINAILFSAAATLETASAADKCTMNDGMASERSLARRSRALISVGSGTDGWVEEERELLSRRQTALELVASMRDTVAEFKERLENGLVEDTQLLTEANRIGFVVEYLAHSHQKPNH